MHQRWQLVAATIGAAILGGATVALARPPAQDSAVPSLVVAGEGLPTVTAWFADGSHQDASRALAGPWRPDRPVRMVTVAATVSCSIVVDEVLVDIESAPANRLAVCVWVSR